MDFKLDQYGEMSGGKSYSMFNNQLGQFSSMQTSTEAQIVIQQIIERKLRNIIEELEEQLRIERAKVQFLEKRVEELEEYAIGQIKPKPIEELTNWLRSQPGGEDAWKHARRERAKELEAEVKAGRMSKIKFYRIVNEMDQKTLAKRLNTKQSNVSRLERVGYRLSIRTLEKLSKIFNVNVQDLL